MAQPSAVAIRTLEDTVARGERMVDERQEHGNAFALLRRAVDVRGSGPLHVGLSVADLYLPHESQPWNALIVGTLYRRGVVDSLALIVADPAICHGRACIRGTRVAVSALLDRLADGMSVSEIVAE